MNPSLQIGLLLAVLYAIECLVWLPEGAFAFSAGRRFSWHQSPALFGARRFGPTLPSLMPWIGVYLSSPPPLEITARGVVRGTPWVLPPRIPQRAAGQIFQTACLRTARATEKEILIDGKPTKEKILCLSEEHAVWTAETWKALAQTESVEGDRVIADLHLSSMDLERATARYQDCRDQAAGLQLFATASAAYLLFALPAAGILWGLPSVWLPGLICWVPLLAGTAASYWKLHRRWYPARSGQRWTHLMSMILLPVSAARAYSTFTREALVRFRTNDSRRGGRF